MDTGYPVWWLQDARCKQRQLADDGREPVCDVEELVADGAAHSGREKRRADEASHTRATFPNLHTQAQTRRCLDTRIRIRTRTHVHTCTRAGMRIWQGKQRGGWGAADVNEQINACSVADGRQVWQCTPSIWHAIGCKGHEEVHGAYLRLGPSEGVVACNVVAVAVVHIVGGRWGAVV